jgi:hypothetical protein
MHATHTVSRAQLYREVWDTPVQTVAARYGISGVGLAKLLKRHRVPVPGRGYWQLVRARRKPRKPPLPPLRVGETDQIAIYGRPAGLAGGSATSIPRVEPIPVPDDLASPHRLVAAAWKSLRHGKTDEHGVLLPRTRPRLDIRVTDAVLERALRIMDGLVKALDARGCPVEVGQADKVATTTVVDGERLTFRLEEYLRQIENPERKGTVPQRAYWLPRYTLVASGVLRLRIDGLEYMGVRRLWQDAKVKRLEQYLGSFVVGLQAAAAALKARREQQAQAERERQAQYQRWLEEERARELEAARAKELDRQVANWERAIKVRGYLRAVERAGVVYLPEEVCISSLPEWVQWAAGYAERLGPRGTRSDDEEEGAANDDLGAL